MNAANTSLAVNPTKLTPLRPKQAREHESSPAEANRQKCVSIASGSRLVETVVSPEGRFQFAVSGHPHLQDSFVRDDGTEVDPSYNLKTMWETGLVKFPSRPAPYGSTERLLEEITKFICRYANVPKEWMEIISLYVLMTWVYDRFTAVGYLRFLGEPGTGKTRMLQLCAAISYKPTIASGNITGPALFRTLDLVRGTMAVDEGDFKNSEEWSDMTKVLNNGYASGAPVVRCSGNDFMPESFHIYGPKIISTRSRFGDEALESRCLTFETREQPLPAHIPLQLPLHFDMEACSLRNQLLQWRFDNFHRVEAREEGMRDLFPRSVQIGSSLAAVVPNEESLKRLVEFLSRNDAGRRAESPKGIVLQALEQTRALKRSSATVGYLAKVASTISEDLGGEELTARKVGGILRSLGYVPRRTNSGYTVDLANESAQVNV